MNRVSPFRGGKGNHLIASGAAFATIWGFFLAANILLMVTSSVILYLYSETDGTCDSTHDAWLLKMGASGLGLAGFFMIPLIAIYVINERWIEQFPTTEVNPLIRTANENARLAKQQAQ